MPAPNTYSGLVLWLRANVPTSLHQNTAGSSQVTADGQAVKYWGDQSGAGNHATNSTGALYIAASSPGNQPGVRFVGASSHMLSSACVPATGAGGRTIFVVATNAQNAGTYCHVLHYGTTNTNQAYGILSRTGGVDLWGNHYWAATFLPAGLTSGTTMTVASCRYDGTLDAFRKGTGVPVTQAATLNTGSAYGVHLGTRIQPVAETPTTFNLHEVVAYNRALSDVEWDEVSAYLVAQWPTIFIVPDAVEVMPMNVILAQRDASVRSAIDLLPLGGRSPYLDQPTPSASSGGTNYYQMAGWRPGSSSFEYWLATGTPNSNNPSGQPIQHVRIVAAWRE